MRDMTRRISNRYSHVRLDDSEWHKVFRNLKKLSMYTTGMKVSVRRMNRLNDVRAALGFRAPVG
jgi:hypothetical protein